MSTHDKNLVEIINKLESKKKESDGFILKYKTRGMSDLEEYYKGVSWTLDYVLKMMKDPVNQN